MKIASTVWEEIFSLLMKRWINLLHPTSSGFEPRATQGIFIKSFHGMEFMGWNSHTNKFFYLLDISASVDMTAKRV